MRANAFEVCVLTHRDDLALALWQRIDRRRYTAEGSSSPSSLFVAAQLGSEPLLTAMAASTPLQEWQFQPNRPSSEGFHGQGACAQDVLKARDPELWHRVAARYEQAHLAATTAHAQASGSASPRGRAQRL